MPESEYENPSTIIKKDNPPEMVDIWARKGFDGDHAVL